MLNSNAEVVVKTDFNLLNINPCTVLSINEYHQFVNKSCSEVRYTRAISFYEWCKVYLKLLTDKDDKFNIFNIKCPSNFDKINIIYQ